MDLGRLLAGMSTFLGSYPTLSLITSGADSFLTSLITRMEFDLAMATSSLHCLKLEPGLRKRAADILIPPKGTKVSVVPSVVHSLVR